MIVYQSNIARIIAINIQWFKIKLEDYIISIDNA